MDSANALSMMEEALQVTADSAAYYDRSLEDTAESLKSFLKGNFENDAALGLFCTETAYTFAEGMIAETQQATVCDERIIRMLQKIYDLLNNEETQYTNIVYLDSEEIERRLVKVRKRKNRRYGGTLNV